MEAEPSARAATALSAAAALEDYFTKDPIGLWRDTPSDRARPSEAVAEGSTFYHIVGAIVALREHTRCMEAASSPSLPATSG
jgi:mannose/cellobiose epimerase-like protein (N-acyl-D-glucosamine 2-epimerase family)